jgi:hypothetical protein
MLWYHLKIDSCHIDERAIRLFKFHEAPRTVTQLYGLPHEILHRPSVFFPSKLL